MCDKGISVVLIYEKVTRQLWKLMLYIFDHIYKETIWITFSYALFLLCCYYLVTNFGKTTPHLIYVARLTTFEYLVLEEVDLVKLLSKHN